MNKSMIQKLKHMLGADERYLKKQWGFRNHYCASLGNNDDIELQEMEKEGLVKQGIKSGTMVFYHATLLGAKAAGFKNYQIKNTDL